MEPASLAPLAQELPSLDNCLESSSTSESQPTFQLFRERKVRVEEGVAYQYRVLHGVVCPSLPWLPPIQSHIQDWTLNLPSDYALAGKEGGVQELLGATLDSRASILLEGKPASGRSSILRQIALDWSRGATYLQHFRLVLLLDCPSLGHGLERAAARKFKVMKQEKVNLAKWEVQGDPFLILLDDFHLLPQEAREEVHALVDGTTFPHCSIFATSSPGSNDRELFTVHATLRGWREEAVFEVIHRQFPHTPNKVLALKLRLSGLEPGLTLVGSCPLLASLLCLAYEDTGDLAGSASETLHTIMRCVFKRELFRAGRVLHDSNYEASLVVLGERCLGALSKGRAHLTAEEVEGLTRGYCQTVLGCLVASEERSSVSHSIRHPPSSLYDSLARRPTLVSVSSSWVPLHPALLHFAAGFYLKSLCEARDLDTLANQISKLMNVQECLGGCEPVLAAALQMLAPANAASDLLCRLPPLQEQWLSKEERLEVAGEDAIASIDCGVWTPLPQAARLRLLVAAGPGSANLAAVGQGLRSDGCAHVECTQQEVESWIRVLEVRGLHFPVLKVSWYSHYPSMADLPWARLLRAAQEDRENPLESLHLKLDMEEPLGPGIEAGEQVHQVASLLQMLEPGLRHLELHIVGSVPLFPLVDALADLARNGADGLESLTLDMELGSTHLSIISSALARSSDLTALKLPRLTTGAAGLKQLHRLVASGKLRQLDVHVTSDVFNQSGTEPCDPQNEYVYEEEQLQSEELKLAGLLPVLERLLAETGLPAQEPIPSELVEGLLAPCLRIADLILPLPLAPASVCPPSQQLGKALASPNCHLTTLATSLQSPEDLLCISDSLLANASLKTLRLGSVHRGEFPSEMCCWPFPLLLAVSFHLSLVHLDLSGLPLSLTTDGFTLCLAALSSNTALSLSRLNLSGWTFNLTLTDKSQLVERLSKLFSTSRLEKLELAGCQIKLTCSPRLLSLYFQVVVQKPLNSLASLAICIK